MAAASFSLRRSSALLRSSASFSASMLANYTGRVSEQLHAWLKAPEPRLCTLLLMRAWSARVARTTEARYMAARRSLVVDVSAAASDGSAMLGSRLKMSCRGLGWGG